LSFCVIKEAIKSLSLRNPLEEKLEWGACNKEILREKEMT
jgi:hypothetical protein